MDLSMKKRYDF